MQAAAEVFHRIGGHQLAAIDDHDALAHRLHFRQDVGGKNNGVIPGQSP